MKFQDLFLIFNIETEEVIDFISKITHESAYTSHKIVKDEIKDPELDTYIITTNHLIE